MTYLVKIITITLILSISISCDQKKTIELIEFDPMSNFAYSNNIVTLETDLTDAISEGIKFPTINQSENGKFEIKFQIKNNTDTAQQLFYKIYYQNESYKYPDESDKSLFNFYGSWQDTEIGFKPISDIKANSISKVITDYIQIVGNPRNEKRYFGQKEISQELVAKKMNKIKSNIKWYNSIKKKAKLKKISVENALEQDAIYVLKQNKNENIRSRRNPRIGIYSFLLVVVDKTTLDSLPEYIKHINLSNKKGLFVNPYHYFLHNFEADLAITEKSHKQLKTNIVFDPKYGIYANEHKPIQSNCNCGTNNELYKHAHFTEFYNHINWKKYHNNIPLIDDVDDSYTREIFDKNANKYPTDTVVNSYIPNQTYRIKDMSHISDSTCSAIRYDSASNSILIINKGNNGKDFPIKLSAGVMTRIGFTYGKVTGKIKFPKLINKHNVWNGITNAFWLVKQEGSEWNNRSECKERGYVSGKKNGKPIFKPYSSYSEIDIEITKAGKYININHQRKEGDEEYDPRMTDNVMIGCTNHDLACKDPEDFNQREIDYNGLEFRTHRWSNSYHAKFLKTPAKHDEIFDRDYYFFEIGWYPDSIVWKIGPDKAHMRTVGFMDHTTTKIPDNQMLVIMSQEFHHGDWWPTSPWHQDNIPYPKNDIIGKLYEIRIE